LFEEQQRLKRELEDQERQQKLNEQRRQEEERRKQLEREHVAEQERLRVLEEQKLREEQEKQRLKEERSVTSASLLKYHRTFFLALGSCVLCAAPHWLSYNRSTVGHSQNEILGWFWISGILY